MQQRNSKKKKQNEQDRRCTSARARIQPPFKCNKKKKPHIHRTHIAFSSRNKNQQRNKCSEQQNKFLALNLSSAGMGLLKGHLSGFVVLPHRATAYICTYITAHGAQRTAFVYGKFIVCIPYSKMPDCWSAIALCSRCILRTVQSSLLLVLLRRRRASHCTLSLQWPGIRHSVECAQRASRMNENEVQQLRFFCMCLSFLLRRHSTKSTM